MLRLQTSWYPEPHFTWGQPSALPCSHQSPLKLLKHFKRTEKCAQALVSTKDEHTDDSGLITLTCMFIFPLMDLYYPVSSDTLVIRAAHKNTEYPKRELQEKLNYIIDYSLCLKNKYMHVHFHVTSSPGKNL